jgi:hypothetical protein
VHDGRRRTLVTVVQVDHCSIQSEGELNLAPIRFIGGDLFRSTLSDRSRRRRDFLYSG